MRILFISRELGAAELALALKKERNEVKLFIQQDQLQDCFEGIISKTSNWKDELDWVGKDGLIVFDDVGYGSQQDELRKEGYRVVGGSLLGDKIEEDREYGQRVLQECGISVLPSFNFNTAEEAVTFIQSHLENLWVVKKNGGHISHYCYVPNSSSRNEDSLGLLKRYAVLGIEHINLQKKAEGIEVGIGRYFNGNDWVGPIEINIEHKGLFPGDIGPKTPEMGTVIWYESDEKIRLYQETLAKLKEYLTIIDFRGDIDLSCFVTEAAVWPLEFTSRFGNPATALQIELHKSPWTEFLSAIADGTPYNLDYDKGMGIIVTIAVPPFPYYFMQPSSESSNGFPIIFSPSMERDEMAHYYFEEAKLVGDYYEVAGSYGCVMHVGAVGRNIEEAREKVYRRIGKVTIPKMFFRQDIGEHFRIESYDQLKKWGWI